MRKSPFKLFAASKRAWWWGVQIGILIALGISSGLAVIVLLVVIFTSWSRNRMRASKEDIE